MIKTVRQYIEFMKHLIDRFLGMEQSEEKVAAIKVETIKKVDAVTASLKRQGELQNKVIEKTTTYYVAKAVGAIR